MTKIGDRLERLHGSRIRALDSNTRQEGVFVAETPKPKPLLPAKEKENSRLASILRNQTLKGKSKRTPSHAGVEFKLRHQPIAHSEKNTNAITDHIKDLRIQAGALIQAGRDESALPILLELVAIVPEHSFGLAKLKTYYERKGQRELAQIFEHRLSKVANY